MAKVIYSECQPIYAISIVFGTFILIFLMLLVFGSFENELVKLVLLILIVVFGAIVYALYQFKIVVTDDELRLSFGKGVFKKNYALSEIDLGSFSTKKPP